MSINLLYNHGSLECNRKYYVLHKKIHIILLYQYLFSYDTTIFLLQVAIATFSAYTLSSSENILTAKKAFVTLAYFNVINFPLTIAAMALSNLMQVNW